MFDEACREHDVFLGFPGNRESAQEEIDRAAARTAIVSFHFSNGRPRELGRSRAR